MQEPKLHTRSVSRLHLTEAELTSKLKSKSKVVRKVSAFILTSFETWGTLKPCALGYVINTLSRRQNSFRRTHSWARFAICGSWGASCNACLSIGRHRLRTARIKATSVSISVSVSVSVSKWMFEKCI